MPSRTSASFAIDDYNKDYMFFTCMADEQQQDQQASSNVDKDIQHARDYLASIIRSSSSSSSASKASSFWNKLMGRNSNLHALFQDKNLPFVELNRFTGARKAYKNMEALHGGGGADLAKKRLEECHLLEQRHFERQKQEFEAAAAGLAAASTTNTAPDAKQEDDTEDDLLDEFFNDVEDATTTAKKQLKEDAKHENKKHTTEPPKTTAALFYIDNISFKACSTNQIDCLIKIPNAKWKNLLPFYVLQLSHYSTLEDIQKRYRSLSLLVHLDKHPTHIKDAQEAFDIVKKAMNTLAVEDKRLHSIQLIKQGLKQARKIYTEQQNNSTTNIDLLLFLIRARNVVDHCGILNIVDL